MKEASKKEMAKNEESKISGKVWLIILQIEYEDDVINIRRLMRLIGR